MGGVEHPKLFPTTPLIVCIKKPRKQRVNYLQQFISKMVVFTMISYSGSLMLGCCNLNSI